MGSFFDIAFPDVNWNMEGETLVCCPFPHFTSTGEMYYEQHASAEVNYKKQLFNCFVCHKGFTEIGFIAHYMNISYLQASQFKQILDKFNETIQDWEQAHQELLNNKELINKLTNELHIPLDTIKQLKLGFEGVKGIGFPVSIFGMLCDVRTYRKGEHPKILSRNGAKSGLIIPFDLWRYDQHSTLICAGEKDMAVARSMGFNAITITGGEGKLPTLFKEFFKNRNVYIIYDNDDAGKRGALNVAAFLKPVTKMLKVIDLSSVCTEKGEDLWDYFYTYNKTKQDLIKLIKDAPPFTEEDYQKIIETITPTLSLMEGTTPKYIGKVIRSNVQVIATYETQFYLPSSMVAEKSNEINENTKPSENLLPPGTTLTWYLDDNNIKDMLYLIDSNLKEDKIYTYKRTLLGIPKKEANIIIKEPSKETVFKCVVTDVYESMGTNFQRTEYIAYSLNKKLENGMKYKITYKLVPHPHDGQKLIMIILDVENVNDSVSNFKLDTHKIELLKQFQVSKNQTLENKIDDLVERVKGIIGENRDNILIKLIDFWYHTVLLFNVGKLKNIRGYLETLIISESRLGKSTTAEALQNLYNLGSMINLGGSDSTVAGLIGGSNKIGGSYQTRAGIIPRHNGSALILEELGRCKNDVLEQITNVRSSNEVRLVRVDGELRLPAYVRMLTLSNTKESRGSPKPMTSYPNGIDIITDLIKSAADIARFDIIACIYSSATKEIDPFYEPPIPLSKEAYQTRIRWVWSRKPDQIIISKEIYTYIINISNQINKKYTSHINIFGIEVWKKITRLAIAIASYVCSTDETFENIIVEQKHVDYAVKFLMALYINDNFRFQQYVNEENKLRNISDEEIPILQQLFEKNPTILLHLESQSETTRNNLIAIAGMEPEKFSRFLNELVACAFIRFDGSTIVPTERFRKGMTKINRNIQVQRTGEIYINVT